MEAGVVYGRRTMRRCGRGSFEGVLRLQSTAGGRARVGRREMVGQDVLDGNGCSRGRSLCGSHRGTYLIAVVAAAYTLVTVA